MTFSLPGLGKPPPSALPLRGMFSVLLGPPGSGKSSFCAQWPKPEFIIDPRDQGIINLAYEGLVPLTPEDVQVCSSYDHYKNALVQARTSPSKTVVCESLIGIQKLCFDHCSKTDHKGDTGPTSFLNFQQGPHQSVDKYYKDLLDLMIEVQCSGKHIWLIGHTKVGTAKAVDGLDYRAVVSSNYDRLWEATSVSAMNVFVLADETTPSTKINKQLTKVQTDSTRWCYPQANVHYPSKNQMGLRSQFEWPSTAEECYSVFCTETRRDPRTGYRRS